MKWLTMLIPLSAGVCSLFAGDDVVRFEKHGFSVRTPEGWHVADALLVKAFSAATHKGVVAHAEGKAPGTDPSLVESGILLLVTKHPLDAKEDNPNVTISVETSWNPAPQNTGATYLALLAERFTWLKAPSRMIGEPEKEEIGGVLFFKQDAVNGAVPDASTRQQYLTTCLAGAYLTFIISYNDKQDADYKAMKAMVESFRTLDKGIRLQVGGDGKPASQP